MTNHSKLVKVRKLIEKEDNWTQRAAAKDRNGMVCYAGSKKARSWCVLGACYKLFPADIGFYGWLREEFVKYTNKVVSEFNDKHKHNEMLTLLDAIILVQK